MTDREYNAALLLAARQLKLTALRAERDRWMRLNSKSQSTRLTAAETAEHAHLRRLLEWIYYDPFDESGAKEEEASL